MVKDDGLDPETSGRLRIPRELKFGRAGAGEWLIL